MPELPEVEALAHHLRAEAVGRVITRLDLAEIAAIKTFDPPHTSLAGLEITGAARHGKFLDLDVSGLHLIVHLARGGWLHWRKDMPAAPPRPGKGPLAMRVHLAEREDPHEHPSAGAGFDLTEAGTRKGLSIYVVRDPAQVPGVARLGPDALSVTEPELAALLAARRVQLKGALTDQRVMAGIGNAYSDEILHTAKLSPFKMTDRVEEAEVAALHAAIQEELTDAVNRSIGQDAAKLKSEKRSGFRAHARTGLPCPVCDDTIREVSFADNSLQYCPTCQTGGKPLADRRMSKLLR